MIRFFFICLFFVIIGERTFSQSIDRQSIVSWSGAVETPLVQIGHSAGETFVTTLSGNNVMLTQGFQQPEPLLLINCQMSFQDSTICQGQSLLISLFSSAPSNASYAWSTGENTPSISVSPNITTTYTCVVTSNGQTCADTVNITVNPLLTWHADNDGDGFGDSNSSVQSCTQPAGFVSNANDCNDAQILAYTGATDVCDNGIDEDCSGTDSTCIVLGCTDPTAFNYDAQATSDDGSCEAVLTCNITAPTTTLCEGESVILSVNTTGGAGAFSQLPANLQQGLVAYYPFNGNANDESGYSNHGTIFNVNFNTDRNGLQNGCANFSGLSSSYISVPDANQIDLTNNFTFSVWLNLNSLNFDGVSGDFGSRILDKITPGVNNGYLVDFNFRNNGSNPDYQNYCSQGGRLRFIGSSIGSSLCSNELILPGWQNIVIIKQNSSVEFFRNGLSIGQIQLDSQAIPTNDFPLIIGNVLSANNIPFHGQMDDLFIYNRALSSFEIQQLYNAQSYAWSTGATTPNITVSPTTNTTYTCTVTSGTQTCTASVNIVVNPAITNAVSATIVVGQSYTLGTQTLTMAGTYTEVFTSAAGCDSTVTLMLSVEPLLTCNITTPTTTLCAGQSATLTMNTTGGGVASSQLPAILQQGLVAYYPFNGNANDESGNGNNGTIIGAVPINDRFGSINSAFSFDGISQYISVPHNSTQNFSSGQTISFWMNRQGQLTPIENSNIIISKGAQTYNGENIWASSINNSINYHYMNGNYFTANNCGTGIVFNSNEWVNYVVANNNSQIKVYLNGVLIQTCAISYPATTLAGTAQGPMYIGKGRGHFAIEKGFFGYIDDVIVYNRALSSIEIQQLYNAQSYAWSTGATTPNITVSPTTNTTYSCTVTSGTQTCTASIDITVNPQQTYFADADGDGYGNPNVVVSNCNPPTGYVTNNTDCNDNDASVHASTTETCNGLDDDCDGLIDEGLTLASISATPVTTALFPTCSGNALKSANLNMGTNSELIAGNGMDLWYSLTAQYNTLRAGLSAAFGDNEIRLYSYDNGCFEWLQTEHEVYTASTQATGNQILITDDLIPGQTYYIAVHNISGAMNNSAKMCFNHFVESTCDHYYSNYTGIYPNVCSSFKAQYKGNASNYIFNILSGTQNNQNINITPWTYATGSALSVVSRIGSIFPANMSTANKTYTLNVPVVYSIPDAAGNYTSITANATTTCTVTMNPETTIALRALDRCPNIKTTSSSVSIDRTICGALRYEWEFTQQLPSVQPAVTVLGGLNTTAFFLNNVPGMGTGKTYNVRVRPIHTNGEVGSWGSVQCLKTGTAGMVMQSENAEAWANHYSPELGSRYTLYPNPTSTGRFILTANHTSDEEVKSIQMMDITGKVVYKTQVVLNDNSVEVDFGNLASGVYVVMVGEERMRLVVE